MINYIMCQYFFNYRFVFWVQEVNWFFINFLQRALNIIGKHFATHLQCFIGIFIFNVGNAYVIGVKSG